MEIYTFLRMGGTVDRISVLPASESMVKENEKANDAATTATGDAKPEVADDAPLPTPKMQAALAEVLRRFEAFDVSNAKCTNEKDKEHLLGVIEQGFGSFDAFNELVRHTFVERAAAPLRERQASRRFSRRGSKMPERDLDAEVKV